MCWQELGLGSISERPETFILCAAALLCLLVGAGLVEPLGRRRLFVGCAGLSAVATTMMAVAFGVPQLDRTDWHRLLLSVGVCGYVVLYNVGMAPISWVIVSEVFPLRGRGQLMGVAIGLRWATAFAVAINSSRCGKRQAPSKRPAPNSFSTSSCLPPLSACCPARTHIRNAQADIPRPGGVLRRRGGGGLAGGGHCVPVSRVHCRPVSRGHRGDVPPVGAAVSGEQQELFAQGLAARERCARTSSRSIQKWTAHKSCDLFIQPYVFTRVLPEM